MKRIAAELGAGTMTLYYYVRSKSDIVALMQDAILAGLLVPGEDLHGGWRDATAAIARRTRQVLMAHPWSLTSLNDAEFGPNAMRNFEQSLGALGGTGLPATAKFELIAVIDDYVSGHALHAVEALFAPGWPRPTPPWSPPRSRTASPSSRPETSPSSARSTRKPPATRPPSPPRRR